MLFDKFHKSKRFEILIPWWDEFGRGILYGWFACSRLIAMSGKPIVDAWGVKLFQGIPYLERVLTRDQFTFLNAHIKLNTCHGLPARGTPAYHPAQKVEWATNYLTNQLDRKGMWKHGKCKPILIIFITQSKTKTSTVVLKSEGIRIPLYIFW